VASASATLAALLARRDLCTHEAEAKLVDKGIAADEAATLVGEFVRQGYINDARYAERYARSLAARGKGPMRVREALRPLKLATEHIEAGIAAVEDWPARCGEVRVRKFGRAPPESWAERAKQSRFLQYRGFSSDHIRLALGSDPTHDETADAH
jgi:regulatory protein